jgi:hypothetical protein
VFFSAGEASVFSPTIPDRYDVLLITLLFPIIIILINLLSSYLLVYVGVHYSDATIQFSSVQCSLQVFQEEMHDCLCC